MKIQKKRQRILLKTKVEIIREAATKSIHFLAKKHGITCKYIRRILGDKEQIMKAVEDGMCAKRAQLYPTKHEDGQEKALQLTNSFGLNDFKANDELLTRFKSRYALCWKRIQGEAGNIDLDEWQRPRKKIASRGILALATRNLLEMDWDLLYE
uniref:Transposase n=1 Tax=Acrobeloides nanus TaxID=290746 RepID=A0A914E686_9BILA